MDNRTPYRPNRTENTRDTVGPNPHAQPVDLGKGQDSPWIPFETYRRAFLTPAQLAYLDAWNKRIHPNMPWNKEGVR